MQDNQALRSLFTLPPVQTSSSTALAVPEMPSPKVVTGDREVDAVLWLQECIRTGHEALIAKALEAAKKITTPMEELSLRYGQYLARQKGAFAAALGSMSFGELERQASSAIDKKNKKHEALSRFGSIEALFADTPAEATCKQALHRAKRGPGKLPWNQYDHEHAAKCFLKSPALAPATLSDCLYALGYWRALYWQRDPFDCGDSGPAAQEHDNFCFARLAVLAPRGKEEALTVLEYLEEHEGADREEGPAILRNLIAGGWA